MPPSRFSQVSRYRNATLTTAKPLERFTELGIGSVPDSGIGRVIGVTAASGHIFARTSTSPNSLLVLPSNAPKKYAKQPPLLHGICQGVLGDFDLAKWQEDQGRTLLAAGSLSGAISVRNVNLPELEGSADQSTVALPAQSSGETSLSSQAGTSGSVTSLQFHPNVQSLLASSSLQSNIVQLWDVKAGTNVAHWDAGTPQYDIKWSVDGSLLAGSGKDATVHLWDARQGGSNTAAEIVSAHASKVKPIKCTFINEQTPHLLLTTGFSQMRQREVAIWDHRNSKEPLKRNTLDVSSSGFEPICEYDRGIVYLVAKGDSSVRWIDVGSQDQGASFAEGVFPIDFSASSAAIAPSASNDVTVGEIAKLYIATGSTSGGASASDAIVPSSVRVPRRNFIDFHADLYPDTVLRSDKAGALGIDEWKAGKEAVLEKVSMDPSLRTQRQVSAPTKVVREEEAPKSVETTSASISQANDSSEKASSSVSPAPIQVQTEKSTETKSPVPMTSNAKQKSDAALPAPSRNTSAIHPSKALSQGAATKAVLPAEKTHWSRRPMAGSTPLISAYQNLSSLDISRSPDARMIAISRRFFALPISGPGGRLGVHPIESTGRLPLHFPSLNHGTPLIDFCFDPFNDDQIISIAADATVRLWGIPEPVEGENGIEFASEQLGNVKPISEVQLPGSGKVSELVPHPFIQGLVAALPADGEGKLHLIDLTTSIIVSIDIPGQGLFSGSWSPDGSVLAVSAKDKKAYILDLRAGAKAEVLASIAAHDSPRSFRCVWVDGEYLLTIGHTIGSLRQIKLFRLGGFEGVEEIAKHNLDASPSVLFPSYDPDTNILYLWSKGERIVSAYEVQPDAEAAAANTGTGTSTARAMAQQQSKEIFTQLPSFQHANPQLGVTFLPKDMLDVRNVEVASAFRVCKSDLQRVSWNVPRSRPEFFQDDVYPPTVLIRQPLLDIESWLSGQDVAQPVPRTSLQPENMTALSQAPPPQVKQSSLSKGPTIRQLTEKEKEDAMFKDIFDKAKGNDGEKDPNHNENQAARAPQNDDWDDDD
ncbi:DUF1900-domain-containing protein [Meira miltonrushii]|uniref:Coronin n=1 Tax=Meira miltonrushii TaxID=1280837 RepID=A0A316VHK8_9BASI|nr:DUF1900-domain-containing protein [Meira miltonrushii]PWN35471.1 DUF1900-domain-containing protein [Meira miltonrushii]